MPNYLTAQSLFGAGMSVSDPLLKNVKSAILSLRTDASRRPIGDHHPSVQPLCETLEDIFRKGLRQSMHLMDLNKRDYWHWLETMPDLCKQQSYSAPLVVPSMYNQSLDTVRKSPRVSTPSGRGRLLIRFLLQRHLIDWPVEMVVRVLRVSDQFYDNLYSIVGNEILAEILLSLLAELNKVEFNFNLDNAAFLDDTWQLPVYRVIEFVPCRLLGIDLVAIEGHQVVEGVQPGSVAAEDNKVETGDIFDELLGLPLKRSAARLRELMRANEGRPVRCAMIKCHLPDGAPYPPIVHLLRAKGRSDLIRPQARGQTVRSATDDWCPEAPGDRTSTRDDAILPVHARLEADLPDDVPAANPDMHPAYGLRYVGETHVGRDGGVHQIESAIARVLRENSDPQLYQPVLMELGEKDVTVSRVTRQTNGESGPTRTLLYVHAYPQISSCGRRIDSTRFLAYIVGESTCTISSNFVCHVFEARSEFESKTVLCSIAQGFERTHWAL